MLRRIFCIMIICALVLSMASCGRKSEELPEPDVPGFDEEPDDYEDLPGFERVSEFSEGLAAVYKNGRAGYIDRTGEFVIENMFSGAEPFIDGVAIISMLSGDEDIPYLYGLINKKGELITEIEYEWIGEFRDGLAPAQKKSVVENEPDEEEFEIEGFDHYDESPSTSKFGFIDITGKTVVPFHYEYVQEFSEGLAVVANDYAFAYFDNTGKAVIPFIYDNAYSFSEGLAVVSSDGKFGCIDTAGNVVVPFEFDFISGFSEGFAAASKTDGSGNVKMGYINKTGETVIPFEFITANNFIDGAAVASSGDGYFYIGKTGEIIARHEDYISVLNFSEGLAPVRKDGNWGFIDNTGKLAIACEYEIVSERGFNDGFAVVRDNNKWGLINKAGDVVIPFEYEVLFDFADGFAVALKGRKCGVIDTAGNVIVPFEYELIGYIGEGLAFAIDENNWEVLELTL